MGRNRKFLSFRNRRLEIGIRIGKQQLTIARMLIGRVLITDINENRYFFTIFFNRVDKMMIRQPFDITVISNLLSFFQTKERLRFPVSNQFFKKSKFFLAF